MKPHILFFVTDDPVYRQSSIRVCNALVDAGYSVTIAGRVKKKGTIPHQNFKQVRLHCWFSRTILFYIEINIRLFLFGLFTHADLLCAVNLDTALPCWLLSVLKNTPRCYDARELFTEQIEIVRRPAIHSIWLRLERFLIPRFPNGIAVSQGVADEICNRYGVRYTLSRNITVLSPKENAPSPYPFPYLLYQGAINYGRGLATLIPAMQHIDIPLVLCGDGNYMSHCQTLVAQHQLQHKIFFTGMLPPHQLRQYTENAYLGINLVEPEGLNQYYSLPNKLFDYMHAGIPQITMNYPEYKYINEQFRIALLIDLTPEALINAIQALNDPATYQQLKANCKQASSTFNWQNEAQKLPPLFGTFLNQQPLP